MRRRLVNVLAAVAIMTGLAGAATVAVVEAAPAPAPAHVTNSALTCSFVIVLWAPHSLCFGPTIVLT